MTIRSIIVSLYSPYKLTAPTSLLARLTRFEIICSALCHSAAFIGLDCTVRYVETNRANDLFRNFTNLNTRLKGENFHLTFFDEASISVHDGTKKLDADYQYILMCLRA